jgi:hypothetical protein
MSFIEMPQSPFPGMQSAVPVEVTVPVIIWSKNAKHIEECTVSMHTTFRDVIDSLELKGVESALVGRHNVPFKLMPGDFEPADTFKPGDHPTCCANTFDRKLVDILG